MSKVSHLNFSLNTNFFAKNISSVNPYFLVRSFIVVSAAMPFGTYNFPMCHNFLIPSYVYIFLPELYLPSNPYFFLHQFNHCLTGNAFYHIQDITTNAICQWLASQQQNKTTPPMAINRQAMSPPCCPPAASHLPPLAAHCSPLAAQCWCWPAPIAT
jgi:hypothetical protein